MKAISGDFERNGIHLKKQEQQTAHKRGLLIHLRNSIARREDRSPTRHPRSSFSNQHTPTIGHNTLLLGFPNPTHHSGRIDRLPTHPTHIMCSLPSPSPLASLSRFASYSSRLLLHRNLNPFLGFFPPPRPGNSRTSSVPAHRIRIVAAYSPLQVDSANSANASTAYRRVADCLVFVPKRTKPRALIHFIGGAFIGAVPEVTYSLFIELLTRQDFLVIATPYNVTFEHVVAAQTVQQKFQQCRDGLIKGDFSLSGLNPENIARLPVLSVGHSNGALLQLLIGCTITEDLPIANAVISFNNKPAADTVPYFEQLGPLTAQLAPIVTSSPLADIAKGLPGDTVRGILNIASPVLTQYDEESLQSLQNFTNQIPVVLDQISKGVSEFSPSPLENRKAVGSTYNIKDTLLIKYSVDAIDESDTIEDILRPRIEEINGCLEKITINGNHITPCVQDIKWEVGKVYTPFDAVGQVARNIALTDIRNTVTTVSSWFDKFL